MLAGLSVSAADFTRTINSFYNAFSSPPLFLRSTLLHSSFLYPIPLYSITRNTQVTIDTLANLRLRLNVTKDRYRMSQVNHMEEEERRVISRLVRTSVYHLVSCYVIVCAGSV